MFEIGWVVGCGSNGSWGLLSIIFFVGLLLWYNLGEEIG